MRKCFTLLLSIIFFFILACAGNKKLPANESELLITPEPVSTPKALVTTAPVCEEEWAFSRDQRNRYYLKKYGKVANDLDLEVLISQMLFDPSGKMVALTFDDGPNNEYTSKVLDILAKYNARATFFLVGYNLDSSFSRPLIEKMLCLGCDIGNHTMNHINLRDADIEEARQEIVSFNEKMKSEYDYDVTLLRPPYGAYKCDDGHVKQLAKDLGMSIIMWRRSVHDSHTPTPDADYIYQRALLETDEEGGKLNGAILLFHDKYQQTVDALDKIIPGLQSQGYQLVTVSELLKTDTGGMNPGGVYRFKG